MQPKLISFGRGGHTIHYASQPTPHGSTKSTLSGYDTPESLKITPDLEGVPVVDVRAAVDTPEGFKQVLSGPMVDVDLPPDGHKPLGEQERQAAASMMGPGGLSGSFATLATLAQDRTYGGLDYVGVGIYLALWQKAGARIGRVEGGHIVWEVEG